MRKLLFVLLLVPFTMNTAFSQSVEKEIRDFAKREYPNDHKMQQYVYEKQISAYRYMLAVTDSEVKKIAVREYSNDYSMQKYTYDKQLSAKRYMRKVEDSEVKKIAVREYSNDYSMQKYTYDKQLSAKRYMKTARNSNAKARAQREYPHDYSMQKYIYDKIVNKPSDGQILTMDERSGLQAIVGKTRTKQVVQRTSANPIRAISRSKSRSNLKASLMRDYGSSYSTIEMLLNAGMEAYDKLSNIPSTQVNNRIINDLMKDYYPHFSTILMLFEANKKAYEKLR